MSQTPNHTPHHHMSASSPASGPTQTSQTASQTGNDASEQIKTLQHQIEQLKHRAVLELKVKLAEAKAHVADLQAQVSKLSGETASTAHSAPIKTVKKRNRHVTIAQVVEAIRAGATNYRAVAAKVGASAATVTKKIKEEGSAAGITSTGEKAGFKLILK